MINLNKLATVTKPECGTSLKLESQRKFIIKKIKENGFESNFEIINEWYDKMEDWCNEYPLKRATANRRNVIFNYLRHEFYLVIGDIDNALEHLYDAYYTACQEGCDDLAKKYFNEIQKIEKYI